MPRNDASSTISARNSQPTVSSPKNVGALNFHLHHTSGSSIRSTARQILPMAIPPIAYRSGWNIATAADKCGAHLNGRPIHVSDTTALGSSLLVTGFAYDIRDTPRNNLDHFARFALKAQGLRRTGSAALDLCYVAAGRFDGFWEVRLNPWDMAAGSVIVQEAGGRLTDFRGNELSIYEQELVASNGHIHQTMLNILNENPASTAPST
jgi:hypothetical protein